MVKNPPASAGDVGLIPGSGTSPGEGNATHSSILAWEASWTEKPESRSGEESLEEEASTLDAVLAPFLGQALTQIP